MKSTFILYQGRQGEVYGPRKQSHGEQSTIKDYGETQTEIAHTYLAGWIAALVMAAVIGIHVAGMA